MKYRPEIDGLRAVAIVPVVFFHAGIELFSGGFVGVDVFFVISGYLITSLIIEEMRESRFSILEFYERRARRILPALFFVSAACIPFALWLMSPSQLINFSESLASVAVFISNIHFLLQTDYFAQSAEYEPLLHTWSLAIEEQFYLLYPALLLLFWSFGQRTVVWLLVAASVISLALAQFGGNLRMAPPYLEAELLLLDVPGYAFYLLPTRGWELAAGALAAFYLSRDETAIGGPMFKNLASAFGAALIVISVFAYDRDTPFPSAYALAPVLGTALIIVFATPVTATARVLSLPAMVGMGLISYSVYLWHQPVFAFARYIHAGGLTTGWTLFLAVCSVLLGYASWRLVERPFRNRDNFSRASVFLMSGVGAALLFAVGAAGVATKGFLFRIPPEDRHLALIDPVKEGHRTLAAFDQEHHVPFGDGPKKKLFVIGDSYAVDVLNALRAAGIARNVSISTHSIASRCISVFIDEKDKAALDPASRTSCSRTGWQDKELVLDRLSAADMVLIVYNWKPEQVRLAAATAKKISSMTNAEVLFVGTKSFGGISASQLLAMKPSQRGRVRGDLGPEAVALNDKLAGAVGPERYVDFMRLVCGEATRCPLYTPDGTLISYDGLHVRLAAAAYVGKRLVADPRLSLLLTPRQ